MLNGYHFRLKELEDLRTLAEPIVKIAVILVVGLLLALLIWKLTIGRRRYRYGKNVRPSRNYKGRKRGF